LKNKIAKREYMGNGMDSEGKLKALSERVNSIIKGKEGAIRLAIAALLAKGHLLIEDVPGVGKTTLAFTLAKAINCSFHRIHVSVFDFEGREFEFKKGPLFANIVLADEINRTTPKTQSALLEAMNERRVSVDRNTYTLPEPFMVIATQNPIEYRGTFPLPESQLDRFALHLKLGYPSEEYERQVVAEQRDFHDLERLEPVLNGSDVLRMQEETAVVRAEESVLDYLMSIISRTRDHEGVWLGASTRGAQFLLKVAKANAYFDGRDFVVPDDIKDVAPYVLGHRIILKKMTYISDAERLIREILEGIPVPV
jgi:MoxR-like ATPase